MSVLKVTGIPESLEKFQLSIDCAFAAGTASRYGEIADHVSAKSVQVVVDRSRVWIKRGVQSFMLAYDEAENAEWYAGMLRKCLYGFTSGVKTVVQPSQARELNKDDVRAAGGIVHSDGNIFFTNIDKLNAAINAKLKQGVC